MMTHGNLRWRSGASILGEVESSANTHHKSSWPCRSAFFVAARDLVVARDLTGCHRLPVRAGQRPMCRLVPARDCQKERYILQYASSCPFFMPSQVCANRAIPGGHLFGCLHTFVSLDVFIARLFEGLCFSASSSLNL
jgi:hypothetical protein